MDGFNGNRHCASRRELVGVGKEVSKHLTQFVRVSDCLQRKMLNWVDEFRMGFEVWAQREESTLEVQEQCGGTLSSL